MPWPISPDRLSPSGPFLPIAGPIKIGSDCVREPQEIEDNVLTVIESLPGVPVQIPIPGYEPGAPLLLTSSLAWGMEPGEDSEIFIQILPILQFGVDGFVPDNALTAWVISGTGETHEGANVGMTTTQHLFVPDPEIALLGGLTVAWFIAKAGDAEFEVFGFDAEGPGINSPSRSWFSAAELDAGGLIQACSVELVPIP